MIDYVEAGGHVYLAGGTGVGGAAGEADRWNRFLNRFGLTFTSPYNGVIGNILINSTHPIFRDVDHLFHNSGNSTAKLTPLDPASEVLVTSSGQGLFAVASAPAPSGTPGCASNLPDLIPGHLRVTAEPSNHLLTVHVGNAGGHPAMPFRVTFYDGEPFPEGVVLGTVSTSGPLLPGRFEDVTVSLLLTTVTNHTVWVVADDNGQGGGVVRSRTS